MVGKKKLFNYTLDHSLSMHHLCIACLGSLFIAWRSFWKGAPVRVWLLGIWGEGYVHCGGLCMNCEGGYVHCRVYYPWIYPAQFPVFAWRHNYIFVFSIFREYICCLSNYPYCRRVMYLTFFQKWLYSAICIQFRIFA